MGKNDKTEKQAATENGEYGKPIYISLNGNGWQENGYLLSIAIERAQHYHAPLYVTSMVGGSNLPPPCPPSFPNCHG